MPLNWTPRHPTTGDNIGGCVRDALRLLCPNDPRIEELPAWIHSEDLQTLCPLLGLVYLQGNLEIRPDVPCIVIYQTRDDVGHAEYLASMAELRTIVEPVSAVITRA
jgi:hypothetical protein